MTKGVTLIELLLYVAVVSIVLMALTPMAWNVIQAGSKSAVQQEVLSNARYVNERINYEIRNSTNLVVTSASCITLTKTLVADNPTIVMLTSGNVMVKRGSAGCTGGTAINSAKTSVSSLVFTDYSGTNRKHVGYTMTMIDNYPVGRQEYDQTITLESSAEVRGF